MLASKGEEIPEKVKIMNKLIIKPQKEKIIKQQNQPIKQQKEANNPREMDKQILIGKHEKHKEQRESSVCLRSLPSMKNHQKRNESEESSVLHISKGDKQKKKLVGMESAKKSMNEATNEQMGETKNEPKMMMSKHEPQEEPK
eukprot:14248286-Ditylum_brightwellii.AAC.1